MECCFVSEELSKVVDMAVTGGVVTIPTSMAIILGAPVDVMLTHPLTEEAVALPGVVKGRKPSAGTVDVRLEPNGPESASALREFIDSILVVEEYDVDVRSAPELRTQ